MTAAGARIRAGRDAGPAGSRPAFGLLLPRHPGDVLRLALALGTLVVIGMFIHRDRVGTTETNLFRLFNDLPGALYPLIWPIMQVGNIVAVFVAAALAAVLRRYRLAVQLAITGAGAWQLAKTAKTLIQRGRPELLLPHVQLHGPASFGRGYPSGHAAVAFAMVTLLSPYLGRRSRRALWLIAILVCLSRVYVGAHLPLDVVGGAALGWGAASAVHLLLGAPSGRPAPAAVRRALERLRLTPVELRPVDLDSRRSARFAAVTDTGERLFVKVIPVERRDRDVVYRIWRRLTRGAGRRPARSPSHQADREAAMVLAAAAAGARVPRVLAVSSYGNGSGLLVQQWIDGAPWGTAEVDEDLLADACRQVAALHSARLAHGDLRPENLLVDRGHRIWLLDFDHAQMAASAEDLERDVTALVTALTALAAPDAVSRAVGQAFRTTGDDRRAGS